MSPVRALVASLVVLAATPAYAGDATVTFESDPADASVQIDGKAICTTPCTATVTTGAHTVVMQVEGQPLRSESLELADGERIAWLLGQPAGILVVETQPPGVEVHVDGRAVGKSMYAGRATPGEREVVVGGKCFEGEIRKVKVLRDRRALVSVPLKPKTRTVYFSAKDAGGRPLKAEVVLDGAVVGHTPSTLKVPVCAEEATVRHKKLGSVVYRLGTRDKVEVTLDGRPHGRVINPNLMPPSRGGDDPRVQVLVFSDFQCPFCNRVRPTLQRIATTYGDDVSLVYMHNPLSFHRDAKLAAIASMAAHRQGRFWEMHDVLFDNQRALKKTDLVRYAQQIGLIGSQFEADLDDEALAKVVADHMAVSQAVGARGTPTFFINGRNLRGAQPFDRFKALIDEEVGASMHAGERGAAWIEKRLRKNTPKLAEYLYDGKVPEGVAPRPTKRATRSVSQDVWQVTVDPKKDPVMGGPVDKALVTVVLFSDFQCPFCNKLRPGLERVVKSYGDKVRLVFKHNPLPFHKDAGPAAVAAECARRQGRFWEMHDLLFGDQRNLKPAAFVAHAAALGLNPRKFSACTASKAAAAKVAADQKLAGYVNARGTPNTFVNGRKLTGAKPEAEFRALIDEELAKATKKVADGTKIKDLYAEIIKNGKTFTPLAATVQKIPVKGSARKGSTRAKIQMVVFSDFQCPFCQRLWREVVPLQKAYGDKTMALSYKHFPLTFHKQARPAARAAICAQRQKKFFAFGELVYGQPRQLSDGDLRVLAIKAGLNVRRYDACIARTQQLDAQIDADIALGKKLGVRGTPTIYVNGRLLQSSQRTQAKLKALLDQEILGKKGNKKGRP